MPEQESGNKHLSDYGWCDVCSSADIDLRSLIGGMPYGVAYCRMVIEQDRPSDFHYVMSNEAFARQTGLRDVVGKRMSEVLPDIREKAPDLLERFRRIVTEGTPEHFVVFSESMQRWFQISAFSPQPEHFMIVLEDVTDRKRMEERERFLTSLYRALSATNDAIIHCRSEAELFPAMCRIATEYGDMNMAWVGVPDADGRFVPAASESKLPEDYLGNLVIVTDPGRPEGQGPVGISFREGRLMVVNDIAAAEIMRPWKDKVQYGNRSLATFPIWRGASVYGVFIVANSQVNAFDDEIVQLLSEMVKNVSFALHKFDIEEERANTEAALRESETRFRQMADAMPHLVWIARPDGFIEYFNSRWQEYAGNKPENIDSENRIWLQLIHPDDRRRVIDRLRLFGQNSGQTLYDEYRILGGDGNYRWFMERTVPMYDETGKIARWCGSCTDIHEKKQAEDAQKLAGMIYQDSSEAMMVIDADNRILTVNPAFEQITGHPAKEVTGQNAEMLFPDNHEHNAFEKIDKGLFATGHWKGELWSQRKSGQPIALLVTANTSFNSDGTVNKRVLLFSDITERKQSDEIIWNQANFDALTGLPNRRFFRERLQHEIRNAKRSGLPMAIIFLDLDGFKYVNDTLGHDMGDILLREAANRLFGCVRETDTVARMGGDEFTVILPELQDANNIDRIARHILRVLSEPISLGQERAYVSASIGITLYPQDAVDADELIRNADQAMYAAKEGGKNRYHYFTSQMQEEALSRMRLINDMRGALEANQFEIVYQPIIELSSGSIHKAEALIRWQHPGKGLVSPIDFISAAEDTGMITSFGNWIFREAAKQASIWRERYHPAFQISVNISPVQFRNEGIDPSVWFAHLRNLGLPGQGVVVEITEGLLLEASPKVTDQLLMLRDAGIEVALDDFGTGYSSLSYLRKFDIDYIKIDQTFVSNLYDGSDDMALCEAIAVMAHRLGIRVIAEGVETSTQHALLANGGCDFAQGFLFSRPIPPDEFEALLESNPFAAQEAFKI